MSNICYMEKSELMRFVEDKFIEMVDNGSISMRDKEVKDMMNNRVARDEFLKIAMSDGYLILMTDNCLRGIECNPADGMEYHEELNCDNPGLKPLPEEAFSQLSTSIRFAFAEFLYEGPISEEFLMTEGLLYDDSIWFVDGFLSGLLKEESFTDSQKEKMERKFELWFEAFDGYDISTFEKYIMEGFDNSWDIQLAYLKSLMSPFIEDGYIEDNIESERFIVNEKFYMSMDWLEYVKAW